MAHNGHNEHEDVLYAKLVRAIEHLDTHLVEAINKNTAATESQTTVLCEALIAIRDSLTAGFRLVAEALNNQQPPPPAQTGGIIMASFKVGSDNPDITITLTGSGFMDSDTPPNPVGAADIDLSVESSNPDAVTATLSNQALSDDGLSVTADVAVHFGAPATDVATLTYRATNRDTDAVVAAGSDDFLVQVGEAAIGTVVSTVPLTPEP